MKEIHSQIEINASPEKVWSIFLDSPSIPNPLRNAIREHRIGEPMKVHLEAGRRGATFKIKLLVVEPRREIRWKGHLLISGLFDGEHMFEIKPLSSGRVLFVQREMFGGLFLPFLSGTLNDTKKEFEKMNKAIKDQAEEVVSSA